MEVRADQRHVADAGVLVGLQHPTALHLRLVQRLLHGADRASREMAQLLRPVLLGVGRQHLFHEARQLGLVGDAVGHRVEARIGQPFGMAERLAGIGEQLLVRDGHVDLAVRRVERAVGRRGEVTVAGAPRLVATDQVVGAHVAQRDQRGVVEREIDVLALVGVAARVERGVDGGHRMDRRHRVDDGDGVAQPLAVGLAVDAHHARFGLQHGIVARPVRERPGLSVGRNREIDQLRVFRRDAGIVEAVLLQHAGPEVLDQHVGALEQLAHDRLALGLGEVQRHALLAPVEGHEEVALAGGAAGARTGALARVVAAVGILDLDDLGAHVREHLGTHGTRDHAGEIDDANAVERRPT